MPALAVFCAAGLGWAQNTNSGDIRGTVTDVSGAVIPGATVTIRNTQTGVTKELTTNGAGIYDTASILPGTYQITFGKEGFEKLVRSGITLEVGVITVDAQLKVGTATQEVQVTAEGATLLKTETAEQSTTLDSKTMLQLPNVGQSWANYTKLIPGAVGSGTGIAVNGNLPYYSNFLADGASTTLPHSANVDTSILETVAELKVDTSTFSAQYGVGGAVFNQISKGGTNTFHGSAYEYLQNDFFNARDFFSPTVGNERYNNFGGSVGGPILKNKLFFYFNVDKTINNSTYYSFNTYPTAAMKAGDFSDPSFGTIYDPATLNAQGQRAPFANNIVPADRLDPLAAKIQAFFPTPNLPGLVNNWQGPLTGVYPFLKWFGRIDYNISDNNRMTFSITQRDNPAFYPSADCPLDCITGDVDSYNAQVSDVWTISPNVVNEFRMGFTRQGNWFTPETLGKGYPAKLGWQYPKADVFPGININGTCCSGIGPGTNAIYVENSFDPSDVVTMIRGRHILHFGGEVLAYQDNSTPWGNVNSGNFTFSGVFTQSAPFGSGGVGYADFLLGQVDSWNASNTPIVGFRQKSPQLFLQDDWKIRPNLTLNLGLRYQIQGGWTEVANRLGAFDPTIKNPATGTLGAMWFGGNNGRKSLEAPIYNIFLPRVGFAWSPGTAGKWAIRGGFGIYSYGWSIDTYSGGAEGLGTNSQGSLSQTNQVAPVFLLSSTNPPLNYVGASHAPDAYNGQSVNYVPYHTPVARNYQWSFSVQRQLGTGMVAQVAYVGSHGTGLSFPVDINQVPANLLATSITASDPQQLRPYPQFQTINGNTFNAISNYDSLQLSLQKRFSRGLSFDVNYAWSKMLDEQDSSGWGSRDGGQVYQDAYHPKANYGLSNFDIPQMFKGNVLYELPVGKGKAFLNRGGVADAVLGGWQASTTFVLESGRPYTAVVGTANNSGALSGNWYPVLVGNPSVSNPTINEWFNPAAFAIPASGTFGNSGRNTLRGPGLIGVDFSMAKSFKIPIPRETAELQFRVDATNVLNHANFDIPDANIGTGGVGIVSGTTGNYNTTNNSFGARVIQLGARLSF